MSEKIKLTIQEIVADFERLVRYDERLDVMFDMEKCDDDEIDNFHTEMIGIAEKYIPNYEKHVDERYFTGEFTAYDKALAIYNMLYENFREIFYKLV